MKEDEIASQHLQGGWRRLYMSGGVCLLSMIIKSAENSTKMSIYICTWKIGMRHRLLWMVWNGDMEMTCEGARRGL